ncbi:TIGR01244 family sulfur transferase [Roseibium sp.]|uniref:TIGR01244 family sulfur transferase n=1 Tax=Roseibium sp. TaxID=1936156 RepID=UPI003BAE5C1E
MKAVNPDLSVAPQIQPEDVAVLAAQGFKSLICNRPDGEAPDQPEFEAMKTAAAEQGLEIRYLPIVGGNFGADDIETFTQMMTDLPKPVLAYCRSGTRSIALWALSEARSRPVADVLADTSAAGYNIAGLFPPQPGS